MSCRVGKTRRKYRECTRRRNVGGGNTRNGAGRRNASQPHGAQWSRTSLSTHAATSNWPDCHHVGVGTAGSAGRCATTSLTVASEQPRLRYRGEQSAFYSSLQVRLTSGRGKTTSVIDTINRRAAKGRLSGTYPYKSKQSNPALSHATRLQLQVQP